MKNTILFIFFAWFATGVFAQGNCMPDTSYSDSTAGVYPLPYDPDINPEGGINTPACIGQDYEFLFTVVVGDSITIPVGPSEIRVKLFSIELETEGAVEGLPEGLSYSCNPPDCLFESNEMGCVIIEGVPEASNAPGDYPLTISAKITAEVLGTIDLTFPGPFYPGEYHIEVLESSEPACVSSSDDPRLAPVKVYPNPVMIGEQIKTAQLPDRILNWTVTNSYGKTIAEQAYSDRTSYSLRLNTESWAEGIYYLRLSTKDIDYVSKMILIPNQ